MFVTTGCDTGMVTRGLEYKLIGGNYESYYTLVGIGDVTSTYIVVPKMRHGRHVTKIGAEALANTSIRSVELPDSILSIGSRAFLDCTKLETINVPLHCKYIGAQAFAGCTSLRQITFSDTHGWREVSDGSSEGTAVDMSDASDNAIYLRDLPEGKHLVKSDN